ncbi:conserved hypothetical protein [Bradyrhizobium oligotrophicum S58]|uniref:Uncharacterized protein n=1 Tax=Bradyrhizobium oligotrophicum S58 TaxID=1245469 RepID=M4ZA91_9BRAD|nr:hypothetical protein [Bradyrhizobium oligotrophicum]BAM90788.1 conserved hypothetical protein [Bradyrhizobium oligotrophicum S58]
MADNDLDVYLTARNVLVEMRLNLAKAVSAGYKKGETETAVKSLVEVQQAIDVIDHASEELEEPDEGEHDED